METIPYRKLHNFIRPDGLYYLIERVSILSRSQSKLYIPVYKCLRVGWRVVLDNPFDVRDVDPPGHHVGADQDGSRLGLPERLEHEVPLGLLAVDIDRSGHSRNSTL